MTSTSTFDEIPSRQRHSIATCDSIRRAIRYALLTGAAAGAAGAPAAQAQDTTIQEVVVTGSRIPQPNLTSISPVTSVGANDIAIEGVTRVEDLINNLPQAFADFGGNLSNGATGAATVNLRNLGNQRTLVLVNGRRLMPGDPTQNGNAAPDLNQIPAALIERVEVLTGGASAVYGADAVGGVVNFIMNDDFEGVRVDAHYGFYQHDNSSSINDLVAARGFNTPDSNMMDGYSKDITFLLGVNSADGRGNATAYAGYRNLTGLLQSERDFSACALNPNGSGDARVCGGSGTTSPAQLGAIIQSGPNAGGNAGTFVPNADGSLTPFNSLLHGYNFAPTNYYQRPDERYTAGLFAHYDVSDAVQVYSEFAFMNDETNAQLAPAGLFFGGGPGAGGGYLVNCNNPFMSPEQVDTFCTQQGLGPADTASIGIGKRNIEGGGRQNHLQHTSYRAVIGARGEIATGWGYDVYGMYGTTEYSLNYLNDFSITRGSSALIAVDDGMGNVVCGVNADADPNNNIPTCVPYNIFTPGGVTPAALNYVQIPGFQQGSTTEQILSGAITADLGQYGVQLPWASDGLGMAFGAEYRSEESDLRNDVGFLTNDLSGQGGATLNTAGRYDVRELFTEARLPIVQDKPFAHSISLEAGYRYSDYSLGFDTDTYKLGADWAPVADFRFRASFQRAVRAPNVQELYRPQVVQLNGTTDPCAGPTPAATAAQCALTGVSAAQYGNILLNSAAQYNGLTGGNPALDPETSDTTAFGFVFTPGFLSGFSVALDYFDISVEDTISTIGGDLTINTCLDSGDPFFCGLVNRAPGSGSLWLGSLGYITDTTLNTGSLATKGLDLEANYRMDVGDGGLAFQLIGTYVDEYVVEPLPGFPVYDCVGLYGNVCGTPVPEFRTKLRTTWNTPWNVDVTLTWRHLDGVSIDSTVDNPNFAFGSHPQIDENLGSRSYFDLTAAYTIESDPANLTFRVGANNALDKDPPIVTQVSCPLPYCSGNTFPQVWDTLGRTVFINVTADF
ncbi:MAG: TonB-dependent receptor domain-containing protein [Steroidobacter sp.]